MAIPAGSTIPESPSDYFKPKEGKKHKLRVLGDFVVGWVGYKDKKGFRRPGDVCTIDDAEVDYDEKYKKPNKSHFWACPIWNYDEQRVQVWEVTQQSIKKALYDYESAEEWGDSKNYDLTVERKEESGKTKYSVIALPPRLLPAEAKEAYEMSDCDMSALFRGEHPIGR